MQNSKSMKKGTCPKCSSPEVHVSEDAWGQRGTYGSNTVPITMFKNAKLNNYICTNCGYVENYIKKDSMLTKIKNKWPKAGR